MAPGSYQLSPPFASSAFHVANPRHLTRLVQGSSTRPRTFHAAKAADAKRKVTKPKRKAARSTLDRTLLDPDLVQL